jgi:hypothetical protein
LGVRAAAGAKIAVLLATLYVTCPISAVPLGPVRVKVVELIVAGFMALLKVAVTIVLIQAPLAPVSGATDTATGAVKPGFPPDSSGSLHPVATKSSRIDMKQIV